MNQFSIGIIFFFFCQLSSFCQSEKSLLSTDTYRIVFYNVENLFDTKQNSSHDTFYKEGYHKWNKSRYYTKIQNISKVLVACGENQNYPSVIALCEVENKNVLKDICCYSCLRNLNYNIVHQDDLDPRGIEGALLYRNSLFIEENSFLLSLSTDSIRVKRQVLVVVLKTKFDEKFIFFVNHWPSRFSGRLYTDKKRICAANRLRNISDSLKKINPNAFFIYLGDFNDDEKSKSIKILQEARGIKNVNMFNALDYSKSNANGTIKSKGNWAFFDHIFVSENLIHNDTISLSKEGLHILQNDFLFESDGRRLGQKPYRTFLGPLYKGGYSDHLPVFVDIIRK
ncbi:MAG: hypothetical protein ACEPOW_01570 [Bacteroidales bacterium]